MTIVSPPASPAEIDPSVNRRGDLSGARVATDMAITWLVWAPAIMLLTDFGAAIAVTMATSVALALPALVAAFHGYTPSRGFGRVLEHRQLLRASICAGGFALVVQRLGSEHRDFSAILVATVVAGVATQVGRAAIDRREDTLRRDGVLFERVLVIADGRTLSSLLDLIDAHPETGWRVVACAGRCERQATERGLVHVGPASGLAGHIERSAVSLLIVAADALGDDECFGEVIAAHRRGTEVRVHAGLRGLDSRGVRSTSIGRDTVLRLEQARLLGCQRFAKRTLDIVVASITLVLISPLLILTAVAIKREDGGPVLFRQRRVGRNGTTFWMPKFRSMRVGSEDQLDELRALNERDGVLFKMRSDPRVTRIGRIIRALSIDEVPQLVSVLRGHMSLVGPRPALPEEVVTFDGRLTHRHDVRPGVTGLWQVEARDSESFDAYRRLDLFYVENWSLLLDFSILLHTAPAVVDRGLQALRRSTSGATVTAIAPCLDEAVAKVRAS